MDSAEPFVLYVGKRFVDRASKTFGLGFIVREPLVEILRKIGVRFEELDRDGAKAALERIGESKLIREKLAGKIEVKGATENLWTLIIGHGS